MKININLLTDHANKLRDFALDLIFPIECFGCGQEKAWLCEKCFNKLKFKPTQYCLHCKKENDLGRFCMDCRPQYALDGVWIAGVYEEQIIAKLIKGLKYHFAQGIAKDLGGFLCLFLKDLINKGRLGRADLNSGVDWHRFEQVSMRNSPASLPASLRGESQGGQTLSTNILLNFNQNLIMPVPLANKRKRWRGFNQAEAIAKEVADYFKLDFNFDKLIRVKYKKPQAKLSEIDRKNNVVGCFFWQGNELAGRNVIIVDDVATTGSTLNECAKVLKNNGAGEVWGLVVAKG